MRIVSFDASHLEAASRLAMENYAEERKSVPALPAFEKLPDLREFAENGLGVTAIDKGELAGFLCCRGPWDGHFGLCKGVYSPPHAHGALRRGRAEIYDRLYQAAAGIWAASGAASHLVTLYAHDAEARGIFFDNGFGGRLMDAMRETAPVAAVPENFANNASMTFRRAGPDDAGAIAPLNNALNDHLRGAPIFLPCFETHTAGGIAGQMEAGLVFFAAFDGERAAAYYRLRESGENFAADSPGVMNICGAYTLPEYRGSGVSAALLDRVMAWLRENGYSRCGVDFESFNPTGRRFWLKHFAAYTYSLHRRIDERLLYS